MSDYSTGRSLASSQIIYEEMGRPFKQQGSFNTAPMGMSHVPTLAPAVPTRRPFAEYDPYASQQLQQQRTLQPRPPRSTDSPVPAVTNGEGPSMIRPITMPELSHEPQRKKRGRPSKEEAEERDRALAAEGKVYQPKKRPTKKVRPSLETPLPSRTGDFAQVAVHTPQSRTSETREEGSSGKRKAKRPPREEIASGVEPTDDHPVSPQYGAQSPSDRLLAPHRERDLDMLLTKELPSAPPEIVTKAEEREQ